MILKTLKTSIYFCRPKLVFEAKDVSALSLCADGDMALLLSGVDINTIKPIGLWTSNEILKYLHVQADPLMRNFSRTMLTHGKHYFLPHQEEVPCF